MARGDHSSRFAGSRGIDDPLRVPLDFLVRDSPLASHFVVGSTVLAHLQFAYIESVAKHEFEGLQGRTACVARQFLEATLLCRCKRQGFNAAVS